MSHPDPRPNCAGGRGVLAGCVRRRLRRVSPEPCPWLWLCELRSAPRLHSTIRLYRFFRTRGRSC
eukprot:scaffold128378_cov63-Phaeocystis_antarctica.AAC.3